MGAVEGQQVALFVFAVVSVAQNHFVASEPRVQHEFTVIVHGQLIGEGIPKWVVFRGAHKTESHVRLGPALDVHDRDVRGEMRVQRHAPSIFIEVVVFTRAGHVHAQHRVTLPDVDVDGAVHLAIHLSTLTRVHVSQVGQDELKVDVVEQLTFEAGRAQLPFDAVGIQKADLVFIHHLNVDL